MLFPIPYLDRCSCFATNLLANADRYADLDKKDITDLCIMLHEWGEIPKEAWLRVDEQYGEKVVLFGLERALSELINRKEHYKKQCIERLAMTSELANNIVENYAPSLLIEVQQRSNT